MSAKPRPVRVRLKKDQWGYYGGREKEFFLSFVFKGKVFESRDTYPKEKATEIMEELQKVFDK